MKLKPDEPINAVLGREALDQLLFVLGCSDDDGIRGAHVQGSVSVARENVGIERY